MNRPDYTLHPEGHPGPGGLPAMPYVPDNKVLVFSPGGHKIGYFDLDSPTLPGLIRQGYIGW